MNSVSSATPVVAMPMSGPQDFTVFYGPSASPMAYRATTRTPIGLGDALRFLVGRMGFGDKMAISPWTYDLDGINKGSLMVPDGICLASYGGIANLKTTIQSDKQGAGFEVKTFYGENLILDTQSSEVDEDAQCLKFYDGATRTPDGVYYADEGKPDLNSPTYAMRLRNCQISCNDWALYDWMPQPHRFRLENCTIKSGRQCVSMLNNNHTNRMVELYHCTLDCLANRSQSVGATSNSTNGGTYGIVAKSGTVRVIGCEIAVFGGAQVGHSATPWCCGIWDGYRFNNESVTSDRSLFEVHNTQFYVHGNGSTVVYDIKIDDPVVRRNMKVFGCYGRQPDGSPSIYQAA